uniref:Secreted protein n=1 Tax=Panagrolaimus davidi TaxID=227884 RepID=A0A914QYD9_9BILA
MKFFSSELLLCFYICAQFSFLDSSTKFRRHRNSSRASGILGAGKTHKWENRSSDEMLSDRSVQAVQSGEDVLLSGFGRINLTLTSGTLEFKVCGCAET